MGLHAVNRKLEFTLKRLLAISVLLLSVGVTCRAQTATITWTNVHQTMQGFGAYNAFVGTAMNPYDTLFFSTLGYSLLRASLPIDDSCSSAPSSSCGSGESDTTDMTSCIANGCKVWASVSSPPADMKTNSSYECTGSATLSPGSYGAYATYMSNYIASLSTYYSVPLYAISVQNEPDYCNASEASSQLSSSQFDTFIKTNLGPTLAANGQSSTLIMMPETSQWADVSPYGSTCMGDSSCSSYVGVIAYHDYDFASAPTNPFSVSQYWETEVSTFSAWDPSITDALYWSGLVHTALVNGATAWHYFWYVDPTGSNENDGMINPAMSTPISQRTYAIAQWAKFVRPGWSRIDATANPVSGVDVTAFKAPSGGAFAFVAVNSNASSENVNFSFSGFTSATVTPYITSSTQSLTALSPVSAGSSLSYTLPASSIMTFTGTNGGSSSGCPTAAVYGTNNNQTLAALGITNCYFISAAGSDSNNGTSESTPWLHAPGMPNCSNTCNSVNLTGGGFALIFRRDDTWHFGNSGASPYTGGQWNANNWWGTDANFHYDGSVSGGIIATSDPAWCSGACGRPIFNADNPLSTSTVASCAYQIGSGNIFVQSGVAWWFDNFEWTGFCSSRNPASGGPFTDIMVGYGGSGDSGSGMMFLSNNYFHGWTVTSDAGESNSTLPCTIIGGGNNGLQSMWNNVIDGSDSTSEGCSWATFPSFYHFKDNIIRYTTQGVGQWCHDIHDNIFEYMQGPIWPTHANVLECNANANGTATNQPAGTPNVVYNNTFRHDAPGVTSNPDLWLCPNATPEYWFNNIMYDLAGEGWSVAGPAGYSGCPNTGGQQMFNNTLVDMTQPCYLNALNNGTNGQYLTVLNEQLINTGFDAFTHSPGCAGLTSATNVAMSDATATSQGYTTGTAGSSQPNQCAITGGRACYANGSTVGAGSSMASVCAQLATYTSEPAIYQQAYNACLNGTSGGVSYNTSNHTVTSPASSLIARANPPDSGAQQFGSGPPVSYTLTVSTAGPGSGTVGGTNCTSGSKTAGLLITCVPSAGGGSTFSGWTGGTCSGTGACSFNIGATSAVIANFSVGNNCGQTLQSGTIGSSGDQPLATPCQTGSNASGYNVSAIYYWVGSPVSTSFDLGVYSNSSNLPSALLCHATTGTITPSSGWNSITPTSCPTLTANTTYWSGYITGSNTIQQGDVSGNCPGLSITSAYYPGALGSPALPNPFGSASASSNCYSLYMVLVPSSGPTTPGAAPIPLLMIP